MLNPPENLYYAIGELAYAVARADGKIQNEESKKFLALCVSELGGEHDESMVSEIIFKVLSKKEVFDAAVAYDMAMETLRTNSHYLSPALKQKAIRLLESVAKAYPPVTPEEKDLLTRFKKDVAPLTGDPTFYNRK